MRMIASFEKTERVRHIGHLDLLRFMQRALRRSGLPVRYSQGFNPHIILSFASPLPVGVSGRMELMDIGLAEDIDEAAFMEALRPALPESLPLSGVRAVDDKHPALMAQLTSAAYTIEVRDVDAGSAMVNAIPQLLARDEIIALRKTKSGEKPCDIRPMIHALSMAEPSDGAVNLVCRTSLMERATLKPGLLIETLATEAKLDGPPDIRLCRTMLFGEKEGTPVPLMEL